MFFSVSVARCRSIEVVATNIDLINRLRRIDHISRYSMMYMNDFDNTSSNLDILTSLDEIFSTLLLFADAQQCLLFYAPNYVMSIMSFCASSRVRQIKAF